MLRLPGFRRAPDGGSPSPAAPPTDAPPTTGRPTAGGPTAGGPTAGGRVRRTLPPAGQLRRERRSLLQLREARLRDLGGLILEMYRRDQFRQDLLVDRCAELATIEERFAELELLLVAAASRGRAQPAVHCECGTPVFWGSKFCAQCGRPTGTHAGATGEGA